PWLDFGGAFFAVAVKEGNSKIYHLDWSDDREALTWVTGLGTWKGGDLRLVELDVQVPMKEGEALCGCMQQLVHGGSPIVSGRCITITFFTYNILMKHSLEN
ncbi:hypothetical protein GG344DRAFT_60315, partial [Lentinula edodes]